MGRASALSPGRAKNRGVWETREEKFSSRVPVISPEGHLDGLGQKISCRGLGANNMQEKEKYVNVRDETDEEHESTQVSYYACARNKFSFK